MGFLQRLFGFEEKDSKTTAKKRLQLVLIHDRTDITPELMNALRRDLVEVITRYMDVDESNIELEMDRDDEMGQVALEVSIPVLRLRRGSQVEQKAQEAEAKKIAEKKVESPKDGGKKKSSKA